MAEVVALRLSWGTLWKVIAAVALVEDRRWPRWAAAATVTLFVFGLLVGFFVLSWSSLSDQAGNLGARLGELEREITDRAPQPIVDLFRQSGSKPDASMLAPYAARLGRAVAGAATVFVLAFILVFYFLLEGERTYGWVRDFVPRKHRARVDETAREAHEAAFGYVTGNVITSACAGAYVYIVLTALGVPASLLLALLAFLFDFIPVLGFFLSVAPAIVMAATVSSTLALAMVPLYLFYDFLENYFIAPRVYGERLEISKLAVLLAFAVGAELAGVVGALLSLPLAAVFPAIDRIWLRRARISQEKAEDQ